MKKIIKYTALTLALIFCLSLLCSCSKSESKKIPAGRLALKEVGTVGEYSVLYEEYYFLANTYLDEVKDSFEGSDDELRAYVEKKIAENIITNHAILALCDREGVEYKKSDMKAAVQDSIDNMITNEFGSRDVYIEALDDGYMTDHYVRFVTEVDLIYSQLSLALAQNGKINADENFVFDYVKENFVRTWHVMIANDEGDDTEENLANAQQALAKLENLETSMYKLIGSALNEDVSMPADGYCFAKGSMEKEYEDAAFSLGMGEYSDVVLAKGENGVGERLDCYYVIQRLKIDDDYISKNYDTLYTAYTDSVIYEELSALKSELEFVPNDYAKGLDVLSLEKPESGFDWTPVIIVGICVLVVAAIAVPTVIILKKKKNGKRTAVIKK